MDSAMCDENTALVFNTQGMTTTASGCHMHLGAQMALLGKLSTLTMDLVLVPALVLVPDLTLTPILSGSKTPPIWTSSPKSQKGLPV